MKRRSLANASCPVARTLDVVGEWWTLLILRDVFHGKHRFDDLQAGSEVPRNVLTVRLQALITDGILERRPYQARPARFEYHLTQKGRELYPVLAALRVWGDRWLSPDGPLVQVTHLPCGSTAAPILTCPDCGGKIDADNVHWQPLTGSLAG